MKQDHFEVLLEDINAKLARLSEGLQVLPTRDEFKSLSQDMRRIGTDVETIKAAVKDDARVQIDVRGLLPHADSRCYN